MKAPAYTLPVRVRCDRCKRWIDGAIEFNERLHLQDTPGFLWTGSILCEACEPGQLMTVP